jgi:hypothetical protein
MRISAINKPIPSGLAPINPKTVTQIMQKPHAAQNIQRSLAVGFFPPRRLYRQSIIAANTETKRMIPNWASLAFAGVGVCMIFLIGGFGWKHSRMVGEGRDYDEGRSED